MTTARAQKTRTTRGASRKGAEKTAASSARESGELSPRIARRNRRRERSREEILDAARRVLVRNGVAATTLDAIAQEAGLTKAALYYYFSSKDALLFDLIFGVLSENARAIDAAVGRAKSGSEALGAVIRETVASYAHRMDDFRLAFLHGQVAKPGSVRFDAEQFARLRPLNDLTYGHAAQRLAEDWKRGRGRERARVEPRLMTFLASAAAIGVLTYKGMVESMDDPLLYSDEQLTEALARIFEAAAEP